MELIRLTIDRHWSGIVFPCRTVWFGRESDDGRMAFFWDGHRIPVVASGFTRELSCELRDQVDCLTDDC